MNDNHNPNVQSLNLIGFYRALECARLLSVAKSTWHLWVSNKTLNGVNVPQPIKLSVGVTVWKRAEVHKFIEQLTDIEPNPPKNKRAA